MRVVIHRSDGNQYQSMLQQMFAFTKTMGTWVVMQCNIAISWIDSFLGSREITGRKLLYPCNHLLYRRNFN